ncbi:MAG: hypothetical protein C4519_17330 [Desulfobacteraceae bacterium]|nr:MAG: hypothetical protein C4519_17330 [Desulfobacteraceae bacterium]
MNIQPEGENLRRAVKWISAERQANPGTPIYQLIERACLTFNLTPADAAALEKLLKDDASQKK